MGGGQRMVPRCGAVLRGNVLAPDVWSAVVSSCQSLEKLPKGEIQHNERKVKVNFALVQAMKAKRGSRGTVLLFL